MTPQQAADIEARAVTNAREASRKHGPMPTELAQRIGARLLAATAKQEQKRSA